MIKDRMARKRENRNEKSRKFTHKVLQLSEIQNSAYKFVILLFQHDLPDANVGEGYDSQCLLHLQIFGAIGLILSLPRV